MIEKKYIHSFKCTEPINMALISQLLRLQYPKCSLTVVRLINYIKMRTLPRIKSNPQPQHIIVISQENKNINNILKYDFEIRR